MHNSSRDTLSHLSNRNSGGDRRRTVFQVIDIYTGVLAMKVDYVSREVHCATLRRNRRLRIRANCLSPHSPIHTVRKSDHTLYCCIVITTPPVRLYTRLHRPRRAVSSSLDRLGDVSGNSRHHLRLSPTLQLSRPFFRNSLQRHPSN